MSEIFLILIVTFLGMLASAASIQAFLLFKLVRELGRASEDLGTARRSLGRILQDLASLTGTVSSTLNKARGAVSALCDTAEALRATTAE